MAIIMANHLSLHAVRQYNLKKELHIGNKRYTFEKLKILFYKMEHPKTRKLLQEAKYYSL